VTSGLNLLDVSVTEEAMGQLLIRPLWFVQAQQPDFYAYWRLLDAQDNVAGELQSKPRFGVLSPTVWEAGMLVEDAYEIELPPGVAAGSYRLELTLLEGTSGEVIGGPTEVITIQLPGSAAASMPVRLGTTFLGTDGAAVA